jgi:hypothetical protein
MPPDHFSKKKNNKKERSIHSTMNKTKNDQAGEKKIKQRVGHDVVDLNSDWRAPTLMCPA